MWFVAVVILYLATAEATSRGENPKVSTPLGEVLGSTLKTRLNKTIYAFRGIKYAKPPIGDIRFKPPVPSGKWSGVYNATADGPACPQPTQDPVSEDCLFLNVYTTKLPDDRSNPKRPVIVFILAGGYYSISSRSDLVGPQYFLDQDIVLVTFNYRLATLGFISIGRDAPGNNGLKDQVVALKWVKNNIESFGGDANSVTLFGYSAGATSIYLHLVSPMSRGLFHRVIMGSGSDLSLLGPRKNQLDVARKQARLVGCPDDVSPRNLLECLKTIPAEDLGNSFGGFAEFGNDPIVIWTPVIEEDYGQERFLVEDPHTTIQRGDFVKVPVVIGITEKELGDRAFNIIRNETLLTKLSNNFDTYAPIAFLYERGTKKSKQVSAAVRKFYLGDGPLTNESLSGLSKLYADSIEGFPIDRLTRALAEKNSQPVYYYLFTYRGRFSHFTLPGSNGTKTWGAVHHDDLIYLFYISKFFPFFDETFPEREMVTKLSTLWTTFAKTGNPIPQNSRLFERVRWEPYHSTTRKYLDIGNKLVLKTSLYQDRYDAWYKLFPEIK